MNDRKAERKYSKLTNPISSFVRNTSVKHKLIIVTMLTCVTALLISGAAFITWEWTALRNNMVQELSTNAKVLAENCKAALAFNDAEDATRTLNSLDAVPSIVVAGIFTKSGEILSGYYRDKDQGMILPRELRGDGHSFDKGYLTVFKPIILDGEAMGTVALRSNLQPFYIRLKRNTQITLVVLVMSTLAAYLISARLQGIISRPILTLAEVAKNVSENKEYSLRAGKFGNDEIGSLIDAFNKMLGQIQKRDVALVSTNEQLESKVRQRTAELTTANEQLKQEIADREKAEKALEALNRDLQSTVKELSRSNRELRDFAYATAHDLKTPLRAIGTLADWLVMDYSDKLDEKGKDQLRTLKGRVKLMSGLIDSILRYSEIGRVSRQKENIDLNLFVGDMITQIAPPQEVEISIENDLPVVRCEKVRIMQVFQNLIDNAVKYMDKPQGWVKIHCVEEDGFYKFGVADNGPGIEKQYHEKIFKIFQTLSPKDESGSTGVGLAVVKKIIDLYGGKVWIESEFGSGSTFFFTLPKKEMEVKNEQLQTNLVNRG